MTNKTGKFSSYFNGGEKDHLGYERLVRRITEAISDGRDYLFWVKSFDMPGESGQMFADLKRIRVSVRIVLTDYTKAEIDEFTVLPYDGFSYPKVERFSLFDENNLPTCIAKIGDVYLEYAGWVAPNYNFAWFRIPADKYELTGNETD